MVFENDSYVGETQQTLKARMKQHTWQETSGLYQHMTEKHHRFDPISNVTIIDREPRYFERGVREAIYERMERPAMNKTGGLRFTLSRSCDRAITAFPGYAKAAITPSSHASTTTSLNNQHSADDSPTGRTETSNL